MTDNLKGILAVLIGSTAFVLNDAIVKLVTAELPPGQIILIRGALSTILLVAGVIAVGAMRPLRILLAPMMLLRLLAAASATICIVIALQHLPLAIVNAALQVTPLLVTAGAAVVFREKVGWRRWLAALAGFLGVVLIVQPGGGDFGVPAYVLLTALFFTTVRDLTTRGLDRDIPSIFVAAAGAAAITLVGFAVVPFDPAWSMPSARCWGLLSVSAVCLFVANTFIIVALRTGEISVVAPFRYAPVPLSLLLGYWWWGDLPDAIAFLGIALVIGAGLYLLYRESGSLRARPAPMPERSRAA